MAVIRRHQHYKDEFMRLYNEGKSDPEIARALNQFPQIIYNWRKIYGLPANHPQHRSYTAKHADYIRTMHGEGATDDEIAMSLGLGRSSIQHFREREGMAACRGPGRRKMGEMV